MAELLEDELGRPKPQFENAAGTGFESWKGAHGAGRVLLWGPNGEPLLTATNPGYVKVTESALPTGAATAAKQDTLADKVATQATLALVNAALDQIKSAVSGYPVGAIPWSVVATSGANSAVSATKLGEAGKKHCIAGYIVALRGAEGGADAVIEIKSDSTVLARDVIGEDSPRGERASGGFILPLVCEADKDAVLSVGAAGPDAITELTIYGYTL